MYTINYYTWYTEIHHIVFKTTWHSIPIFHYALCTTPIPIPNFQPSKRHFYHAILTTQQPTIPLKSTILCNMPTMQLNSLLTKCISHTDVLKQLYIYTCNSHNTLNCIYISPKSLAIFSFTALFIKSFRLL